MIKNNLLIAWRNLIRNKVSSYINIAGLSIGIASVLMITLFIQHELGYDKFHKDAGRIFQVTLHANFGGQEFWNGNTPPPVGNALASHFPEIESFTRFYKAPDIVVRNNEPNADIISFTEKNILGVDSNFLQVFDFSILEGNPKIALMKPGSLVITENVAKKYFGNNKVIGKTLLLNKDKKLFTITAVLQNIPSQSSVQFDFLASLHDFPVVKNFSWSWVWQQMMCFVKIRNNVNTDLSGIKTLEQKFPSVVKIQAANAFRRIGKPFEEFVKNGGRLDFHLLPLADIHLRSGIIGQPWLSNVNSIRYVYIFGCIALFIIILASVNFMNLSTARAGKKAKEIGIRKVAGSVRSQLVMQFLTEAFLYTFISTIIAILLVLVLLKPFAGITGESISPMSAFSPAIWITLFAMSILVALLAGSYPAFYLTSFHPSKVLKGGNMFKSGKGSLFIRNGLVIFQFAISTILIMGTLVVFRQLEFFRNTRMGFNKENVIVINNTNRLSASEETYRQKISQLSGVVHASRTTSVPSGFLFGDSYEPIAKENEHLPKDVTLTSYIVDVDFIPVLEIEMLNGRNFSDSFDDSLSVIVNEETVGQIGWKDPIGKQLRYPGGNNQVYQVIGVVKNFNVQSLHSPIVPFALFHTSSHSYDLESSHMIARIEVEDISATLDKLQSEWKNFAAAEPFDYYFLDASFDALYRSEQRMGSIFIIFAGLSIFIACLGLFGLTMYVAERRTKEIGIRKVLGASVVSVVQLLSKDFLRLTLLAAIIAFPIAWWAMNQWLEDFAYRIPIDWTIFLLAGMCTLIVSLLTISFQAIRAAISNPVECLRTE